MPAVTRTNVVLDDALMGRAMEVSGLTTKKAALEEGLRALIQQKAQQRLLALRGKIRWQGDLKSLRQARFTA